MSSLILILLYLLNYNIRVDIAEKNQFVVIITNGGSEYVCMYNLLEFNVNIMFVCIFYGIYT